MANAASTVLAGTGTGMLVRLRMKKVSSATPLSRVLASDICRGKVPFGAHLNGCIRHAY